MKSAAKKTLSLLVALVMLLGVFPGSALAADPVTYPYDEWTVTNQAAAADDTVSRAETVWKTLYGTVTAAELKFGELRYWVYLPEDYDASREYPLVVYLHSSNVSYNQGTGYTPWFQTLNQRDCRVADGLRETLGDCIIFTPQVPGDSAAIASGTSWTNMIGSSWKNSTEDTSGSTNYLKAAEKLMAGYISSGVTYEGDTYAVNASRVYLIGDSMGAIGAYAMLEDCPTTFAAAMVRAGIGNPNTVASWKDTPIRIFHGTADTNIPYEGSTKMINALEAAGAKDAVRITVQDGAHDIRTTMYQTLDDDGNNVYLTWLSQQSKSDYAIESAEDYIKLCEAVNTGDTAALAYVGAKVGNDAITQAECAALNVSLANDITLTEAAAGIGTTAMPFAGVFDGNNHTVAFDSIACSGDAVVNVSLLGRVVNGTICNVKLAGEITYTDTALKLLSAGSSGNDAVFTAPLCAYISGSGVVSGVASDVDMIYTNEGATAADGYLLVNGLVGQCYVPVYECEVSGDMSIINQAIDKVWIGGVLQHLGYKNCANLTHSGSITLIDTKASEIYTGGIAMFANNKAVAAKNCVNSGIITVSSTGAATASPRVGGLVGSAGNSGGGAVTIQDGRNEGTISVAADAEVYAGGAIGLMAGTTAVTIDGFKNAADILGSTTAADLNSSNGAPNVTVGGIVGRVAATGKLTVSDVVAEIGTVEAVNGTINSVLGKTCYTYIGGLIGQVTTAATLDIQDCFVASTVRATTFGTASAQERAGGFIGGINSGSAITTIKHSFFDGTLGAEGNEIQYKLTSAGIVYDKTGTAVLTDCGYTGTVSGTKMYKLDITQISDTGMVAVDVTLTENVWGGATIPEALTITGTIGTGDEAEDGGVSVESGKLKYAKAGTIELTIAWNGNVIATKTVTIQECDHDYSDWTNTAVETHSKTCEHCLLQITEDHAYEGGVCAACGRREGGVHTCSFSEGWTSSDFYHWHPCTYPGCVEVSGKTGHSFEDGVCTVCERAMGLTDAGYVYTMASAEDYLNLMKAVNSGDATALTAVAKNITGDAYVEGMSLTQEKAATLDVEQTDDFTLSYTSGDNKPVGIGASATPFSGDYDGGTYTVTFDVTVSGGDVENIALLGNATGNISNVKLAGSIAYQDSGLKMAGKYAAPLAAAVSGTVKNCASELDISYDNAGAPATAVSVYVSGLCGANTAEEISNCTVSGDITVKNSAANALYVSGVVAKLYNICDDLTFSGTIDVDDTRANNVYVGGIATHGNAVANAVFNRLSNSGTIDVSATGRSTAENFTLALAYVGGIVAHNDSSNVWTLKDCENSGDIIVSSGTDDGYYGTTMKNYTGYIGGIMGYDARSILTFDSCANIGDVTYLHTASGANASSFNIRVGGIMGCYNNTSGRTMTMVDCSNSGKLYGEQASGRYRSALTAIGGMLGQSNAASKVVFDRVSNSGTITSTRTMYSYLGGIGGDVEGQFTVNEASNSGNIYTSDASYTMVYTGGFAGRTLNSGSITDFANTGIITASVASSGNASRVACAGGVIGAMVTNAADVAMDQISLSGPITARAGGEDTASYAGYMIGNLAVRSKTGGGISMQHYPLDNVALTSGNEPHCDGLIGKWSYSAQEDDLASVLIGKITVTVTPADAVVTITDAEGVVMEPEEDGSYVLPIGDYSYTASRDGYYEVAGEFTVDGSGDAIAVELEKIPTAYRITVGDAENGAASTDYKSARAGRKVTVTVTADEKYIVKGLTVKTGTGRTIAVTDNEDGTYTFTMPGAAVTITAEFGIPFTDIEEDHKFYAAIEWVYVNGLMIGKTEDTFDRASDVSRQQVWMVLGRIQGADPENMAAAKEWAMAQGITDGTRPGEAATREEFITMMWKAFGAPEADTSVLEKLSDADAISEDAKAAMAWAVEAGITEGYEDGTMRPAATITRGAFAAVLYRYLNR